MRWVFAVGLMLGATGCDPLGSSRAEKAGTDGAAIPVEPRAGQTSIVDVLAEAAPDARPGCAPAPEGIASTQLHFEVEPVTGPDQTFVLDSAARVIRFYDDETELSLRQVHSVYERADGVFVEEALPYLKVGDGCLELLERVELQSGEYHFTVTNEGCESESRSGDDYVYRALGSCTIRIETDRRTPVEPRLGVAHHSLFALNDRFATTLSKTAEGELLALHSTGTILGNVDTSVNPPEVRVARAGLDVVTSFGVANLEIDYFNAQVVGAKRDLSLGPQNFTLTISDIGNGNTHCYTGTCKNVFDLDVLVEPTGARSPIRILSYE
jgi:hypothetical protein